MMSTKKEEGSILSACYLSTCIPAKELQSEDIEEDRASTKSIFGCASLWVNECGANSFLSSALPIPAPALALSPK